MWRLTIYKTCNVSWLKLVQFLKLGPKRSKLKKLHPKVASSEFRLGPKISPIICCNSLSMCILVCSYLCLMGGVPHNTQHNLQPQFNPPTYSSPPPPRHRNDYNRHWCIQQQHVQGQGQPCPQLCVDCPGHLEPKVLHSWGSVNGGAALPQVLWNKCEGCEDPLGSPRQGQLTPQEEPPKASALGTLFFEGVPQTEPGVLSCWRICWRRGPKDPLQMGLVVHQCHSQSGWRHGKFTQNVRMVQIVVFYVMTPCDSADFPMLASVRKCKKMWSKKLPFFFHTCPHTPAAATPSTADQLQQSKKGGCPQQLSYDRLWVGLTSVSPQRGWQ